MTENKLELIAKLLAKAERTTPHEAEVLTEAAERLMIKYGIEQAQLDAKRAQLGQETEPIVQQHITLRGVYAKDMRDGLAQVVFALGMRPLQKSIDATTQVLYVVGFESDVKQALVLMESLQLQAVVAMRDWWKGERAFYRHYSQHDQKAARGAYVRAFGSGAAARIHRNRQQEVTEAGTGAELVLVSRKQRVDEYVDSQTMTTARERKRGDGYAYSRGYDAGQEANTGERALSATLAITGTGN